MEKEKVAPIVFECISANHPDFSGTVLFLPLCPDIPLWPALVLLLPSLDLYDITNTYYHLCISCCVRDRSRCKCTSPSGWSANPRSTANDWDSTGIAYHVQLMSASAEHKRMRVRKNAYAVRCHRFWQWNPAFCSFLSLILVICGWHLCHSKVADPKCRRVGRLSFDQRPQPCQVVFQIFALEPSTPVLTCRVRLTTPLNRILFSDVLSSSQDKSIKDQRAGAGTNIGTSIFCNGYRKHINPQQLRMTEIFRHGSRRVRRDPRSGRFHLCSCQAE